MKRAQFMVIVFCVIACTGPQVPVLPRSEPDALEKIQLGRELSAASIREIARGLNSHGRFPAMARLIENTADQTLDAWAGMASHYWYEDADREGGLARVLWSQPPLFFQGALEQAREWAAQPGGLQLKAWWDAVASHSAMVPLLKWIAPAFQSGWEFGFSCTGEVISEELGRRFLEEIGSLITPPQSRDELVSIATDLSQETLVRAWADSVRRIERNHTEAAWPVLGSELAQLIGRGGANSAKSSSEMAALFELLDSVNRPSEGIFHYLSGVLRKNSSIRQLVGELFAGRIRAVAVSEIVQELRASPLSQLQWLALAAPESDGFRASYTALFNSILKALRAVTPLVSAGPEDIRFERRATLYVNSLVVTEWFHAVARKNRVVLSGLPSSSFLDALLSTPLEFPAMEFDVMALEGERWSLTPLVLQRLSLLELDDLAGELGVAVAKDRFANFNYTIEAGSPKLATQQLVSLVESVDWTRPLLLSHEAAGGILQLLESDRHGPSLGLSVFETGNLLSLGLAWFRDQPDYSTARRQLDFILNDLGLGRLTPADLRLALSLFEDHPAWRQWVESVLSELGVLADLVAVEGAPLEPTILEWTYEFLQGVPNRDIPVLLRALSFVADSKFFDSKTYPGITTMLGSPVRWTGLLQTLSKAVASAPGNGRGRALLPDEILLKVSFDLLAQMATQHLDSSTRLLQTWSVGGGLYPALSLSADQFEWLNYFLASGGGERLVAAIKTSTRASVAEALMEIEGFIESGDGESALRRLRLVDSLKFQLGIETLRRLHEHGELLSLVRWLRFWAT